MDHRHAVAPGQEFGIGLNRIHQREHLLGGMADEHRFLYDHFFSVEPGSARPLLEYRARQPSMSIVQNKKAFHDYFIEERFEAGMALEGWEVKAIREGRAQLKEAYVIVSNGELFLIGSHVSPLPTASTHIQPDPTRTRKLLLNASEIDKLIGAVERAGYTLVPVDMHYTRGRIKLEIGLAKGKKQHDKREAEKDRDWKREQQRLLRQNR
jgi:SsrA-binding protein